MENINLAHQGSPSTGLSLFSDREANPGNLDGLNSTISVVTQNVLDEHIVPNHQLWKEILNPPELWYNESREWEIGFLDLAFWPVSVASLAVVIAVSFLFLGTAVTVSFAPAITFLVCLEGVLHEGLLILGYICLCFSGGGIFIGILDETVKSLGGFSRWLMSFSESLSDESKRLSFFQDNVALEMDNLLTAETDEETAFVLNSYMHLYAVFPEKLKNGSLMVFSEFIRAAISSILFDHLENSPRELILPESWECYRLDIETVLSDYQELTKKEKLSLHSLLIEKKDGNAIEGEVSEQLITVSFKLCKLLEKLQQVSSSRPDPIRSNYDAVFRYDAALVRLPLFGFCKKIKSIVGQILEYQRLDENREADYAQAMRFSLKESDMIRHSTYFFLSEMINRCFFQDEDGDIDMEKVTEYEENIISVENMTLTIQESVLGLINGDLTANALTISQREINNIRAQYKRLSEEDQKRLFSFIRNRDQVNLTDEGRASYWYPMVAWIDGKCAFLFNDNANMRDVFWNRFEEIAHQEIDQYRHLVTSQLKDSLIVSIREHDSNAIIDHNLLARHYLAKVVEDGSLLGLDWSDERFMALTTRLASAAMCSEVLKEALIAGELIEGGARAGRLFQTLEGYLQDEGFMQEFAAFFPLDAHAGSTDVQESLAADEGSSTSSLNAAKVRDLTFEINALPTLKERREVLSALMGWDFLPDNADQAQRESLEKLINFTGRSS